MDQEIITLSGTIESVVFRNEGNGWTVLEMDCEGELVTVVGPVFQVCAGDGVRVTGAWVNHPSYGRQFKAESMERSLPATADAILKYLSSGAIKGIAGATAKRIVELFGAETLEVIENEPLRLTQIKGISQKKALQVNEEYKRQFGVRTCMLFLQQYNVTAAEALRIWKRWGGSSVDTV
ncbi:MAG: ATP-dependent RecD-like DNA helicase, partial [Clostridia bacterium]|nr:ATP-dependent RecD-like DNA helicase [Clostridia bacterium]